MKTRDELWAEKRAKADELDAIFAVAQKANRAMNAAEQTRYDAAANRLEEIEGMLEQGDRHDSRKAELMKPVRGRNLNDPEAEIDEELVNRATIGKGESMRDWLGSRGKLANSSERLSFGKYLRGALLGKWDGAGAEQRAMSELTGPAGGYMVPASLSADLIDRLRTSTAVFQAGASVVPMLTAEMNFARLLTGVTASWRGENQEIDASDPTLGATTLRAKSLAAMVIMPRELLEDAPNIEQVVTDEVIASMKVEVDRVGLRGLGAANEPAGLDSYTTADGINERDSSGALADYDDLIDLYTDILTDNGPEPKAAILHPRTVAGFAKLKTGIASDKTPLRRPEILDKVQFLPSTGVSITEGAGTASRVYLGDWSELVYGIRTDLTIIPLRERYAEKMQVAFLVYFRGDIMTKHIQSFGRLIGITP